jgi:hypothetical protein
MDFVKETPEPMAHRPETPSDDPNNFQPGHEIEVYYPGSGKTEKWVCVNNERITSNGAPLHSWKLVP